MIWLQSRQKFLLFDQVTNVEMLQHIFLKSNQYLCKMHLMVCLLKYICCKIFLKYWTTSESHISYHNIFSKQFATDQQIFLVWVTWPTTNRRNISKINNHTIRVVSYCDVTLSYTVGDELVTTHSAHTLPESLGVNTGAGDQMRDTVWHFSHHFSPSQPH